MIKTAQGNQKDILVRIFLMKKIREVTENKISLVEARNIVLAVQGDFDLVPRF